MAIPLARRPESGGVYPMASPADRPGGSPEVRGPPGVRTARRMMEVAASALSGREQQVLTCIAAELAASDPKLASTLAYFNRLTRGEEMPAGQPASRSRRREANPSRTERRRTPKWWRQRRGVNTSLFLVAACVLISAALITAPIVMSNMGHGPDVYRLCAQSGWMSACARQ